MDRQRSSAPADGRAHSLWATLRSLIEAFRTPKPSPVPVIVTRTVRRRR
ncbi:MAG: hypothetical protein K0S97_54 [Chloroflexota bacterium]|jgi:hypothetical protein|nr:hypothetical protein [Chloroflexota bacterium]